MKIYDLTDSSGHAFAFEVSNRSLGRGGACRIAAGVAGARVVRRPQPLSWLREEVFCEFEVNGVRFQIAEPSGSSNRYRVGPVSAGPAPELATVRAAFARAGVPTSVR